MFLRILYYMEPARGEFHPRVNFISVDRALRRNRIFSPGWKLKVQTKSAFHPKMKIDI